MASRGEGRRPAPPLPVSLCAGRDSNPNLVIRSPYGFMTAGTVL
jgi:hypothetical protein